MTRVALVSDSHGNAAGLRAALDDIATREVGRIVALGDMVQGGPHPAECLDLIRAHSCDVVLGNADAFLLDAEAGTEPTTEELLERREWTLAQLSPDDLDLIVSFVPTVSVESEGRTLLCFHATPSSYDALVLPADDPAPFAAPGADVLAGGHVHVPQLRRVGPALYVNPGSVGLGYDHLQPENDFWFDPWASYAIVDLASLAVEFHRVPYPVDGELREWARFRPSLV